MDKTKNAGVYIFPRKEHRVWGEKKIRNGEKMENEGNRENQ